jgi:hypothetical protein
VRAGRSLATLAAAYALAGEAAATGPFDGRWGTDARACEPGASLIVSSTSLRWRDVSCVIRTSYRVRDALHIGARCLAEGVAADVPIELELRGGRPVLDWAGASSEELRW